MKLLYIWVKNYKIFKNQEFNFCDNINFSYSNQENCLKYEYSPNTANMNDILELQYSPNIINSITALVGHNGSGKTTLAQFINNCIYGENRKESILVYEVDSKYYYYSFFIPNEIDNTLFNKINNTMNGKLYYEVNKTLYASKFYNSKDSTFKLNSELKSIEYNELVSLFSSLEDWSSKDITIEPKTGNEKLKFEKVINYYNNLEFDTVYYSPFLSESHNIHTIGNFTDLSKNGLISNIIHSNIGSSEESKENTIKEYLSQDLSNIIDFLHSSNVRHSTFINKKSLPNEVFFLPEYINNIKSNSDDELIDKISKINFIDLSYTSKDKFILHLIRGFLLSLITELPQILYNDKFGLSKEYEIRLNAISDNFNQEIEKYRKTGNIRDFAEYIKRVCEPYSFEVDIRNTHKVYHFLNEFRSLSNLLDELLKMNNKYFEYNNSIPSIRFDISNEDDFVAFRNFYEQYKNTYKFNSYLDYAFNPVLSSGEYSVLHLYSVLHKYFEGRKNKKHQLLFIDEVEGTLHPELQRNIIANLIDFFNQNYDDLSIHLVFATHSPFLVSDIPRRNCIFLNKTGIGYDATIKINSDNYKHETFAANIHDLFAKSFFLDSNIGELSKKTIEWIVENLQSQSNLIKIKNIINSIGEPLIKYKLLNLLEYNKSDEERIIELKEELEMLEGKLLDKNK